MTVWLFIIYITAFHNISAAKASMVRQVIPCTALIYKPTNAIFSTLKMLQLLFINSQCLELVHRGVLKMRHSF